MPKSNPTDHARALANLEALLGPLLSARPVPLDRCSTHSTSDCRPPCPVHAPSNHPLRDARAQWRPDVGYVERVCAHGVGHPDPDDLAVRSALDDGVGVHGCDGCCREPRSEEEP